MSDSVGKITLDLELQSDLSKQIETAAGQIGEQIKASLKNIGNFDFKAIADTLSNTIKRSIEDSMKNVQSSIEKALNKAVAGAVSTAKNIKIPMSLDLPESSAIPKSNAIGESVQTRAPPIAKIDTGVSFEAIKAQIDNLTSSLDITNAKIEQQKAKLEQLKESYNQAFDGARKNKLEEEILKTEASINRLTAASDKAGFKLADMDVQFATLSSTAKNATAGVNAVDDSLKKTSNSVKKATEDINLFGNGAKNSTGKASIGIGLIGKMMDRMIIRMFLFNTIIRGLTALGSFLGQAMMTNTQFARSLIQIKTNLEVAFMPIYQAVLPALNALMNALSRVTAYIAAFINALFGKTYSASFGAAKNLNSSIASMKAMEDQSKKTSKAAEGIGDSAKKAAKEAKGSLAGFDEINQLQLNKDKGEKALGGGGALPAMIAPGVDLSPTNTAMKNLTSIVAGFKKVLATLFAPMKAAWLADGAGVMTEFHNAVNETVKTVKHFFSVLGSPPVQGFLTAVDRLVLSIVKLALKIYDSFILPIVNWFINLLPGAAKGLTPIVNVVRKFVDYLAGPGFRYLQVFLGALLGVIAGIKTFKIVMSVEKWFTDWGKCISQVWKLISDHPIVAVIAAIAAVITILVTLYNTNKTFHDAVNKLFTFISGNAVPILRGLGIAFAAVTALIHASTIAHGLHTAALIVGEVAEKAFTAAQWLFNAALSANPIGIVIIAITALVAALAVLYNKNAAFRTFINNTWAELKAGCKSVANAFKAASKNIEETWDNIKTDAKEKSNAVKDSVDTVWNSIKTNTNTTWNNIKQNINTYGSGIKGIIATCIDNIKSKWDIGLNGISSLTGEKFTNIVGMIKDKMNSAFNVVKDIISGIKSAFNFHIKFPAVDLPHIPLPHFNVSGKFSLNPPSIPSFGVNWYAKGGIFNKPSVVGVGEAGKEAVMPLENNTGWISQLANKIGTIIKLPQPQLSFVSNRSIQAATQNANKQNNTSIDSDNDYAKEMIKLLKMILEVLKSLDFDINVDGDTFAKAVIKQLNKRRKRTGVTELEV